MPGLLELSPRFILSYKAKICAFSVLRIVKVLYAQCEARSSQYSGAPAIEDLANNIGVSRKTISTIEVGRFVPSTVIALKIARYFKVPVEEIFSLKEVP
ncbi:helix-turn-helix domain-containing protein [candidate division KSB1 bacterium]|nr:helix-turn-helix domain-containing protein [candidate division KSB1 bacterium]